MSVAELKSICEAREVRNIAIVDDVFDTPAIDGLDRTAYAAFRQDFNADEVLRGAVARVAGTVVSNLPGFDNVEDGQVAPIWRALWRSQIGGRRLSATHRARLRAMFSSHVHDVLGMLDLVLQLLVLFQRDLDRTVTAYGTDFDADDLVKSDIVLVDFFLGQNLTPAQALERSSQAVEDIVKAARKKGRATPSFLLISSRPEEIEIEKFRKRADLMKSRFRFFPKSALRADSVEDLVSLHDLVDASDRAAVVEGLLDDWKAGATKAIEVVHKRMLELDIADLVYLDCFRLTHEGTTIGNYLRWFLTASLHARVTGQLSPKTWKKAEGLRLFSVLDESGQLDPASLVKTFDGPSDVIAAAYGDILFDETRGFGVDAFPSNLSPLDLMEGDLFVKPRGRDRQGLDGAEVRMIMTPSCDLLPRQLGSAPAAKTVLFVAGKLKLMDESVMDSRVTDVDFVRVVERSVWRIFQIDWDHKNPITVEWGTLTTSGVGKGFRRLGRIRDLYLHKIREDFASALTRIGTEVAPLFPRAKAGTVYVAVTENGKRRFDKLLSFEVKEGLAWEIGPIELKRPGGAQPEKKLLYQASRKLAARVMTALDALPKGNAPIEAAVATCKAVLGDMTTYMDLVRPMKPGLRGKDGTLEFKVAAAPGAPLGSSTADLLVIPRKDS